MLSRKIAIAVCSLMLAASTAVAADPAVGVTGKWKMTWHVAHFPNQTAPQDMTILLQVRQDGGAFDGKAAVMLDADKEPPANQDTHPVQGSLDGKAIAFTIPPHYESPEFKIHFTGALDGNTMSGTTDMGDTWTATRVRVGAGGKLRDSGK